MSRPNGGSLLEWMLSLCFSKKLKKGGDVVGSYFLLMRRRLVQAMARNRVATTRTINVAIGSH